MPWNCKRVPYQSLTVLPHVVFALEKQPVFAGVQMGLSQSPIGTKDSLLYMVTRSLDIPGLHAQFLSFKKELKSCSIMVITFLGRTKLLAQ